MGQDQSTALGSRHSPAITPSSSSTSHSKSFLQNKIFIPQPQDEESEDLDNSRIIEEEEEDDGIIQVVKGPDEIQEDPELKLLRSIKRFEPFIKEQEKGFSFEHLLGLKSTTKLLTRETETPLNPAIEIFFDLQAHLKDQMTRINIEQRILLRRIAYVDELSSSSAHIVATSFNQAQTASDRVAEATLIKEQAEKTQLYAINIFKSLTALEKYLDPEDIIGSDNSKWTELNELRQRAFKSNKSVDRITKTTANDLTTVGTSTSPLLERVIVTGEPAFHLNTSIESNTENDPAESSTSTSSLALSRLRGLTSRSVDV